MQQIKKKSSVFTIIIAFSFLFQGCAVYYKNPITLDQAVDESKPVKLKSTDGSKVKLKRVELKDGQYYGVKRIKGEVVQIPLDSKKIENIRLKNMGSSIGFTILLIGVTVPLAIIAIPAAAISSSGGL